MKYEGKIYGKVAGKYIQLDVNPNLVDAAPDLLAALKLAKIHLEWVAVEYPDSEISSRSIGVAAYIGNSIEKAETKI